MKNFVFKKRIDVLLLALALAVLGTGLLRIWYNSYISTVSEAPAVTIVFTQWWEDDLQENILSDLIKEFEGLNEGIRVVLSFKSYEDLLLELLNNSENGFPGDVLALDPLWVPEFELRGIIEEVSPPFLSFINVLYYNIDILRDAGFSRPPKTRGEFINYARTVTDMAINLLDEKRWGLVVDKSSSRRIYDDVYPWIWSGGAQLISDGRPVVNSRPVIESLSFLASLNSEGLILKGNKLEDFSSGRAAFMLSLARDIEFVRERMGDVSFDISTVPLPDNYAGRSFYGSAEWAIGISTISANKEEARLFVDFLTGKSAILADNAGALPMDGGQPSRDPFHSKIWDIAIAWNPTEEFSGLPWMELEKAFCEELSSLFEGELSATATAAAIQRRWGELLHP
jgi:multiple sugar transport system substrate-binding protein